MADTTQRADLPLPQPLQEGQLTPTQAGQKAPEAESLELTGSAAAVTPDSITGQNYVDTRGPVDTHDRTEIAPPDTGVSRRTIRTVGTAVGLAVGLGAGIFIGVRATDGGDTTVRAEAVPATAGNNSASESPTITDAISPSETTILHTPTTVEAVAPAAPAEEAPAEFAFAPEYAQSDDAATVLDQIYANFEKAFYERNPEYLQYFTANAEYASDLEVQIARLQGNTPFSVDFTVISENRSSDGTVWQLEVEQHVTSPAGELSNAITTRRLTLGKKLVSVSIGPNQNQLQQVWVVNNNVKLS